MDDQYLAAEDDNQVNGRLKRAALVRSLISLSFASATTWIYVSDKKCSHGEFKEVMKNPMNIQRDILRSWYLYWWFGGLYL